MIASAALDIARPCRLEGEVARLGDLSPSRSGRGGLPSKQELLARAKWMRANPTDAERKLWQILRNKRLEGYKFKRQVILDWYIADFVNFENRVIVEADGSQHLESAYDIRRDAYLKAQGFSVLRFWNSDILRESTSIEDPIWHALQLPSPLAGEGGPEGVGRGRSSRNFNAPAPSPSLAARAFPSPARGEG